MQPDVSQKGCGLVLGPHQQSVGGVGSVMVESSDNVPITEGHASGRSDEHGGRNSVSSPRGKVGKRKGVSSAGVIRPSQVPMV